MVSYSLISDIIYSLNDEKSLRFVWNRLMNQFDDEDYIFHRNKAYEEVFIVADEVMKEPYR